MVTEVGFEFRDRSSNPIECQITDEDLRQFLYILLLYLSNFGTNIVFTYFLNLSLWAPTFNHHYYITKVDQPF